MKQSFNNILIKCERELQWLWGEADSVFGQRSNFSDQIRIQNKLTKDAWWDAIHKTVNAVDKRRKIEKVYYSLSQRHQDVLFVHLGWKGKNTFPPEIINKFGEYTPDVVAFNPIIFQSDNQDKILKERKAVLLERARLDYRNAVIAYNKKYQEIYAE